MRPGARSRIYRLVRRQLCKQVTLSWWRLGRAWYDGKREGCLPQPGGEEVTPPRPELEGPVARFEVQKFYKAGSVGVHAVRGRDSTQVTQDVGVQGWRGRRGQADSVQHCPQRQWGASKDFSGSEERGQSVFFGNGHSRRCGQEVRGGMETRSSGRVSLTCFAPRLRPGAMSGACVPSEGASAGQASVSAQRPQLLPPEPRRLS